MTLTLHLAINLECMHNTTTQILRHREVLRCRAPPLHRVKLKFAFSGALLAVRTSLLQSFFRAFAK